MNPIDLMKLLLAMDLSTVTCGYTIMDLETEEIKLKYQKAINEITEESALWELRDEIANANYLAA